MNLTPSLRRRLYEAALEMGANDVDGGVDASHLLTHALAETPDGPLQVRDDFGTIDEREWTPHEIIAGTADFYGMGERAVDDDVSILVRVTARAASDDEPFEESDLFYAVAAAAQETFPADGGAPVLARFERLDANGEVVREVAHPLSPLYREVEEWPN